MILAIFMKKRSLYFRWRKDRGSSRITSDMSGPIITKILNHGTSKLPTLSNSSQHMQFLKSSRTLERRLTKDILVPIT